MHGALKTIVIIFEVLFLLFLLALNVEEKPRARRLVINMNIFLSVLIIITSIASFGLMIWRRNMSLGIMLIPQSIFSAGILFFSRRVSLR